MNQIKGDRYEIQIRDYVINSVKKPAYLWKDTPETLLINSGIIGSHNENRTFIMKNKEIYTLWTEFIISNEYGKYFEK